MTSPKQDHEHRWAKKKGHMAGMTYEGERCTSCPAWRSGLILDDARKDAQVGADKHKGAMKW